jgi:RNA polymerase sigma-70 factor, ECF subfamily
MAEPLAAHGTNRVEGGPSDQLLLERIAAGDREAFRALYDRYGPRVMTVVRKKVTERHVAEELVQDVFVAAWLGAAGYREHLGDAARWLFGITRHKVLDHQRRLRRLVAATAVAAADRDLAETRPSDADSRLSIDDALIRLTDDQRRLIKLIYGAGLTFAEAARALHIPEGTVKSRINAALTTLRSVLARSNL